MKEAFYIIMYVLIFIFIVCIGIPLLHDFLFDRFTILDYDVKEGVVSDVIINDSESNICENIVVDGYNIFVQCGNDYKQKFKIGDKTMYYIYKDVGYHTEAQIKSASFVGKLLDYGMIGTYILIFYFFMYSKDKIFYYIDNMSGNTE